MNYGGEERKPVPVSVHHKNTRGILTLKVSKPVTLGVNQVKQTPKPNTHPPTKRPEAADRENSHAGTLWRQLSLPQRTFLYLEHCTEVSWQGPQRMTETSRRPPPSALTGQRQQRLSHAVPKLPAPQITLWETSILLNSRKSRWLGKLGLTQVDPKPNLREPRMCIWTHYRQRVQLQHPCIS